MAWFRLEVLGQDGKMIECRHVELSCTTVGQALVSSVVNRIKKDAIGQGFGFRVKLEEDGKEEVAYHG